MPKLAVALAALTAALLVADVSEARVFSQVDRNRDGVVTWDEARWVFHNVSRVHFDRCDRTNTGSLNQREFLCLRSINDVLDIRRD